MTRRVAVLVDGDNLNASYAEAILRSAKRLGSVDVTRVYTNANRNSDWLAMPGFRVIHAGTGKNAADILLSIDAIELALACGIDAFAIATSDRDFAHVAFRLREHGHHVLGMGEGKSPGEFRQACAEFSLLTVRQQTVKATGAMLQGPTALDHRIRKMIAEHGNDVGMRIIDLNPHMKSAHGTRISEFPEKRWRTYLTNRPNLYDIDPKGPDARVRCRPQGFGS